MLINPLTKAVKEDMNLNRLMQTNGAFATSTFLDEVTTFMDQNVPEFVRMGTEEDLSPHKERSYTPQHEDDGLEDEEAMLAAALAASEKTAEEEAKTRATTAPTTDVVVDSPVKHPVLKQPKVEQPPLTQLPQTMKPPDLGPYLVTSPPSPDTFRLRFRMPSGTLELHVAGNTPVGLLLDHIAYEIHLANPAAHPQPPVIELRGGFPPTPLSVPNKEVTLTHWGCLRQTDNVLVHLL
jgi:hypothetical protein